MKKIIDANYFHSPELKYFLSASKDNIAVLCDFACMELYKGNAIKSISRSMEVVSEFPNQIEVLKPTREVVKFTVATDNSELFIDQDLTDEFLSFCTCIQLARDGSTELQSQIIAHGKVATAHFELTKHETKYIVEGLSMLSLSFSTEELNIIKKGRGYTPSMIDKMLQSIYFLTDILFERHPDITKPSMKEGGPKSYLFRYALSCYLLFIRWIANGGIETGKEETLKNEIVDMAYVAYATYFDGLLSHDQKMNALYDETDYLIKEIFMAEQNV